MLIHDTTELDFSGLNSIETLGLIGNGHNRGYLCHNRLAVDPQRREVIGLAGQILHTRVPVPPGEGVQAKRERASRESRLWTRAIEDLPAAPEGQLWVDVADRGAGLFEPRPLLVWVIRVWEVDAPAGTAPLEWILLTNVSVQTTADAWVRVNWYECRWIVEEFHKAQKTGSRIQEMQFTSEAALQPMIAVLSVVALQLLNLRAANRQEDAATRLATQVVHPDYVAVLSAWRCKEVRLESSVKDFFYALARRGATRIASATTARAGWCCGAAG